MMGRAGVLFWVINTMIACSQMGASMGASVVDADVGAVVWFGLWALLSFCVTVAALDNLKEPS